MSHPTAAGMALLSTTLSLCACTGSLGDSGSQGATTASSGPNGSGGGASSSVGVGTGGAPQPDSGRGGEAPRDGGPTDPCGDALFCEKFDDYAGTTTISDGQKFGPWHAALKMPGASMNLDATHTVSGSTALHMHIDTGASAGGRLFSDGDQPIFASKPTHVYGRMMMYIDPNGTSVHWTFFGVSGDAEPSSPAAGRNASYIMSSLAGSGDNTYSFVYGLQASGNDPFHDCSSKSGTSMPTAAWSCISFEMDSVARKLRMSKDGAVDPILAVDDHGKGCVGDVPVESPWYGPAITQLFVGGWSFHPMNAPLDVWIDDVVVDTQPVSCPVE